jgi:thiamine-phosphate pyrophosphorylase
VTPRIGRLVVITDTTIHSRFSHVQLAGLACAGGADVIQLRDKQLPDADFSMVAADVRDVCARHGAQLIINDRVEIARATGASGVHVGRTDMSIGETRTVLGSARIIGASAGSVEEARDAERAGADYVGVGHIFATSSKLKTTPPVGLDVLRAACAAVRIPVIAIGGITHDRVRSVMEAGAHGVAVIAEVCNADDPRAATARLRAAIDTWLLHRV